MMEPANHVGVTMIDLKRLGLMLAVAVGIVFLMIVVSFYVGHTLGQQTVAQEIRVEPIVRAHNEFQIDTHLAIQESQKQPATFKVGATDGTGRGATITQEQLEQITRSIASVKAEVGEIKNGVKSTVVSTAEAKTMDGADKPKPIVLRADAADQKTVAEHIVDNVEKAKESPQAKPSDVYVPATITDRLTALMDRAEQVALRMESSAPGTRRTWETKWKSRLQDNNNSKDENQLANEALIERLISIKGSKDAGKPLEMNLAFETAMILLRYKGPNMQLPSLMLDVLKKDDKSFAEALNFITQVAKAP